MRTACSLSVAGGGVSLSADCDEADIPLSTTDFGVSAGAGREVGITSRTGVAVEFLYDLGLQGLGGSMEGLGGSKTTRVLSILAGLVFSL